MEKYGATQKINKPITLEEIWKRFTSIFYLTDLTFITLWLSNSLQPHHSLNKLLPDFLTKCMRNLKENLEKYRRTKYICLIMGIDKLTDTEKKDLKANAKLLTLREDISKAMTWDIAKQFLKENIIEADCNSNLKDGNKMQINSIQKRWREQLNGLGTNENFKKLVYYTAFSQTLIESLHLLESKVMESLIEHSQSLVAGFSQGE